MSYDSTVDARKHIANINWVYETLFKPILERDIREHDQSKLTEPERSCYDKYIPELRKHKFGSPEYLEVRKEMQKEGLDHHFAVNRHHPEHFENGCEDMNLVDFCCFVIDCYASSLVSDTSFEEGMKQNMDRNHIPPMLQKIVMNTASAIFKNRKPTYLELQPYIISQFFLDEEYIKQIAEQGTQHYLDTLKSVIDAPESSTKEEPKKNDEKKEESDKEVKEESVAIAVPAESIITEREWERMIRLLEPKTRSDD